MSLGGGSQQSAPQVSSSNTAGNSASNSSQTQDQSSTSNINQGPWGPQQQYIQSLFGKAQGLGNTPFNPFPGATVAQPNTGLQAGWQDVNAAAHAPPSSFGAAGSYLTDVLNGKYLSPNSNPYLAGMEQAAADPVIRQYQTAIGPGTASAAATAGRYGSGAANTMRSNDETNLVKGLGDLSANFYGNAYNTGINQMQGAAGMAPGYLASSFLPSQAELTVGQQQQDLQQRGLTGQFNQWLGNQMLPWQNADMYKSLISGNYGQTGTQTSTGTGTSTGATQGTSQGTMTGTGTSPYYSNPVGSAFGGGLAGLGTLGQLGWSPFGSGGGGGGGGGLFSGLGSLFGSGGGVSATGGAYSMADAMGMFAGAA